MCAFGWLDNGSNGMQMIGSLKKDRSKSSILMIVSSTEEVLEEEI